MKIHTFVFKFVDHAAGKLKMISVDVYCDKRIELPQKEDLDELIRWKTQHIAFEYKLKQEVKNFVKEHLSKENEKFDDYTLKKKSIKSEGELINTSQLAGEVKLEKVFWMEVIVMKFVKGTKPEHWTKIFGYDKSFHHYAFNLTGDEKEPKLQQPALASFDVPLLGQHQLKMEEQQQEAQQAQQLQATKQKGGDAYMGKYMKYKQKYMRMKNQVY